LTKRNINVYGCSWTHGVGNLDQGRSWPYYLSQMLPKSYTVNNFALAGSSIEFAIYQLQKNAHIADINIFQITSTHRVTQWDIKYFHSPNLVNITDNYREYDKVKSLKYVKTYNVGAMSKYKHKHRDWFKEWIRIFDPYKTSIRRTQLYYVKDNSDFCFGFLNEQVQEEFNLYTVDNEFSVEKYGRDKGHHFGHEGNQLVAGKIYEKIAHLIVKDTDET